MRMHMPIRHQTLKGLTLVELVIVLAVVGILAGVAYPSYSAYVLRSHRSQAHMQLQQAAHWMERIATATGRYPTQSQQANALEAVQTQLSNVRYAISLQSMDGVNFLAKATPQGVQVQDPCGTLTLSQAGERGITEVPDGSSWTAAACWSR